MQGAIAETAEMQKECRPLSAHSCARGISASMHVRTILAVESCVSARLTHFISNEKGHQYTHHLVVLACDDTVFVGKNGPVTRVAALTNLNWA